MPSNALQHHLVAAQGRSAPGTARPHCTVMKLDISRWRSLGNNCAAGQYNDRTRCYHPQYGPRKVSTPRLCPNDGRTCRQPRSLAKNETGNSAFCVLQHQCLAPLSVLISLVVFKASCLAVVGMVKDVAQANIAGKVSGTSSRIGLMLLG